MLFLCGKEINTHQKNFFFCLSFWSGDKACYYRKTSVHWSMHEPRKSTFPSSLCIGHCAETFQCISHGPFLQNPSQLHWNSDESGRLNSHHFDWLTREIPLGDRCVVSLHDVDSFARQSLNDWLVGLKGGRLVSFENESTHATIELRQQQQPDHRRLDVLLFILVSIEGVPHVLWYVIWKRGKWKQLEIRNK